MKNNSCMFRCGESINKNINMDNWIASDEVDYVERGVSLLIKTTQKYKQKIKSPK